MERDTIDFSPVVTRLMAKGVNLILEELTPAQTPTFIKQAWELGYKGRMGILRAGYSLEDLLQAAGKEALEGFISAGLTGLPINTHQRGMEKFRSKYLSLYKEEPQSICYYVLCWYGVFRLSSGKSWDNRY